MIDVYHHMDTSAPPPSPATDGPPQPPFNAAHVRQEEWDVIKAVRSLNGRPVLEADSNEWNRALTGLALSGGGIRAATFHLGLLQALCERRLLQAIDYISAVSGGAFIASWFTKLLYVRALVHPECNPLRTLMRRLSPRAGRESAELHRLRQHLTYLTPQGGILSQSTWLLVATYLHNLFINFLILSLAIAALVMTPRAILAFLYPLSDAALTPRATAEYCGDIGAAAGFGSLILIIARLVEHRFAALKTKQRLRVPLLAFVGSTVVMLVLWAQLDRCQLLPRPGWDLLAGVTYATMVWLICRANHVSIAAQRRFVACTSLAACLFLSTWLCRIAPERSYRYLREPYHYAGELWEWLVLHGRSQLGLTANLAAEIVLVLAVLLMATSCLLMSSRNIAWFGSFRKYFVYQWINDITAIGVVIGIGLGGLELLKAGLSILHSYVPRPPWLFAAVAAFGAPLAAIAVVFTLNFMLAVLGRVISAFIRLQIAEISTVLYRYSFIWMGTFALALYGPLALYETGKRTQVWFWSFWALSALVLLLVRRTPQIQSDRIRQALAVCLNAVPYLFLTGYLLMVSFAVSAYVYGVEWVSMAGYWASLIPTYHPASVIAVSIVTCSLFLLSMRFGVNSSTMHFFYQWRLAASYLCETLPGGEVASPPERPLVNDGGLRTRSALRLTELTPNATKGFVSPYLLLNSAMNLRGTDEPAWQDRRAASFLFSPLFCGYQPPRIGSPRDGRSAKNGYTTTAAYRYDTEEGLRLAHAMAISGSAIGSHMGSHTSPRIRFINTLFNLRLGWWFPNPRVKRAWEGHVPRSRVGLLLSELLGTAHDRGAYVNLSDGAHFENLGIYELVRRRCRVIIASDASEDSSRQCGDLGNAVERCRADFGIEIEMPAVEKELGPVTLLGIRYGPHREGILIYLRATVVPDAPLDIRAYGGAHPSFPNEPTSNQWFKEAQFESYRRLGLHIGRMAIALITAKGGLDAIIADPDGTLQTPG